MVREKISKKISNMSSVQQNGFCSSVLPVLGLLVLVSACAEITLPTNELNGIHVSGSSTVKAPPDIATMQVGVQTFAEKAEDAVAKNNGKVEAMIVALLEKGIAEADIQTTSFNISPQREYKANHPPVVIGFNVSNMLSVTIRNLDRVGQILQATIDAGAFPTEATISTEYTGTWVGNAGPIRAYLPVGTSRQVAIDLDTNSV